MPNATLSTLLSTQTTLRVSAISHSILRFALLTALTEPHGQREHYSRAAQERLKPFLNALYVIPLVCCACVRGLPVVLPVSLSDQTDSVITQTQTAPAPKSRVESTLTLVQL